MLVDTAIFARTYDQEQWKHAFGVALVPGRTTQDINGTYTLYQWFYGIAAAEQHLRRDQPELQPVPRGVHAGGTEADAADVP